jgi:hypothetical protein
VQCDEVGGRPLLDESTGGGAILLGLLGSSELVIGFNWASLYVLIQLIMH